VTDFTYRSARSGSLMAGIGLALAVETVALHLWLVSRYPTAAWTLTAFSLATGAWLAADYFALGRGAVRLGAEAIDLTIGRRVALRLPRAHVAAAVVPTWREIPERGTPDAADYLDLARPATPNVLLTLREPTPLRLGGGARRTVRRVGFHLDEPEAFVRGLSR